ncbi:hypothetical protein SETIT_3G310500v2 [Setaria italica]|uniref:Uncharacterized protein n=1 Tax=Setaria italica TaxID=4555 RepID=A0A368QKQ3_SETIT|nr:hypothetical protein SETIT_3G310500v2 [Setaria italica]
MRRGREPPKVPVARAPHGTWQCLVVTSEQRLLKVACAVPPPVARRIGCHAFAQRTAYLKEGHGRGARTGAPDLVGVVPWPTPRMRRHTFCISCLISGRFGS